jgi:anti-sigma regulatory factor (Ser/Thr protein kinase)
VTFEKDFPNLPKSVPMARRFAAQVITDVPSDICDVISVIVSELATNCVRHAGTGFKMRLAQQPRSIRIECEDQGNGDPVLRAPSVTDTSGRGLQIVAALADDWGVVHNTGSLGKAVWATIGLA